MEFLQLPESSMCAGAGGSVGFSPTTLCSFHARPMILPSCLPPASHLAMCEADWLVGELAHPSPCLSMSPLKTALCHERVFFVLPHSLLPPPPPREALVEASCSLVGGSQVLSRQPPCLLSPWSQTACHSALAPPSRLPPTLCWMSSQISPAPKFHLQPHGGGKPTRSVAVCPLCCHQPVLISWVPGSFALSPHC